MKISVVTINCNNEKGLEQTMQSVMCQNFKDLEYIIIDGGSTDGSAAVIRKYSGNIQYWCSEADRGVFNARNKGIQKATGEYIIFLNSGDYFFSSDSISILVNQSDNVDIVYGDIILALNGKQAKQSYPVKLDFNYFHHNTLPHPCTLIKRELFMMFGMYKEELRICADWAFFVDSIARYNRSYKHVNHSISVFNLDGLSSSKDSEEIIKMEKSNYFLKEYSFFDSEYKSYMNIKNKFDILKASGLMRIISAILSGSFRKILYE